MLFGSHFSKVLSALGRLFNFFVRSRFHFYLSINSRSFVPSGPLKWGFFSTLGCKKWVVVSTLDSNFNFCT